MAQKLVNPALLTKNTQETAAALGTNQATAYAIAKAVTFVTGADGTVGVILPAVSDGTVAGVRDDRGVEVTIVNTNASSALKVYPASGGTINGAAANAALSVAAAKTARLFVKGIDTWWAQVGA